MQAYHIIAAKDAREMGYYSTGDFILERDEREYEPGIWLVPEEQGYALWFGSFEALEDWAKDKFDENWARKGL